GAEERAPRLEDDAHGDEGEQRLEAALGAEGLEETWLAQERQDAGRDAAAEIEAGGRERLQGEVPCDGAEGGREQAQRGDAARAWAGDRRGGDRRGRAGRRQRLRRHLRMAEPRLVLPEESPDGRDPGPGDQSLPADVTVPLSHPDPQAPLL